MFSKVRGLCSSLIILLSIFLYSDSILAINFDDIRIDVPPDGRVHVENRFGDVSAEVWDKPFVSVSAVVAHPYRQSRNISFDLSGSFTDQFQCRHRSNNQDSIKCKSRS